MICTVCHGAGSVLARQWPLEWWTCPKCGGAGVSIMYGAAERHIHSLPKHLSFKAVK